MFLNTLLLITVFLVITDLQSAMTDIKTTNANLHATKVDIYAKLAAVETGKKKMDDKFTTLLGTAGIIITTITTTNTADDVAIATATAIMAMSICFLVGAADSSF